jgi:hypothetical protein
LVDGLIQLVHRVVDAVRNLIIRGFHTPELGVQFSVVADVSGPAGFERIENSVPGGFHAFRDLSPATLDRSPQFIEFLRNPIEIEFSDRLHSLPSRVRQEKISDGPSNH